MGPVVQLDSAVLAGDQPVEHSKRAQPVMWHRDRSGFLPPPEYLRPHSVVFMAYMQEMTDDVGPLRVIPGSHRYPRTLSSDDLHRAASGERLLPTRPGDMVAIHHNLLHAGGHNVSARERRFLGFIYNQSMLRQEDNFSGPNCQALIATARRTRDRRLLRLLGVDPLIFPRQNSGFTEPAEAAWQQWLTEDAAPRIVTAGDN